MSEVNLSAFVLTRKFTRRAKGAELDSAAEAPKQKVPFAAVWCEAGPYII